MRVNIVTQIFLKLNQSSNTIQSQSPSSSPPPNENNIFNQILMQLNEWVAFLPNLIHSLMAKFNEAFPPETRAHWLEVATRYMIAALGVVALCMLCYCCFSAIVSCIAVVVRACWICIKWLLICIKWLLMMLWRMCQKLFMCLFCCSGKMMTAPGTGGALLIPRAMFEAAPRAYFAALRAGTSILV